MPSRGRDAIERLQNFDLGLYFTIFLSKYDYNEYRRQALKNLSSSIVGMHEWTIFRRLLAKTPKYWTNWSKGLLIFFCKIAMALERERFVIGGHPSHHLLYSWEWQTMRRTASYVGQTVLSPEPWKFFKKEVSFSNPLFIASSNMYIYTHIISHPCHQPHST